MNLGMHSLFCVNQSPILSFRHLYLKFSSSKEAEMSLQKPSCIPFKTLEKYQNYGSLAVPHTAVLYWVHFHFMITYYGIPPPFTIKKSCTEREQR